MFIQDKQAEVISSSEVPDDSWLENPQTYYIKKSHLEMSKLVPLKGNLILDAGCGPDTYGIVLAEEGNEVRGIDISSQAVHKGKERANKRQVNFVPLIGDMERLPFKDNTFDNCFCGWVLHHFRDLSDSVAELIRVLKPGGRIAIVEPNESNIALRLSRLVEYLLQRLILKVGWDTPNRTTHRYLDYVETLKRQNVTHVKYSSCYPGVLPPIPIKSQRKLNHLELLLLRLAYYLRHLFFAISVKVLPSPLNGCDLLITGKKAE